MAAVKWNQDLNAGQNWMADINLLNTDGTGRDITGQTLVSQVRRHYKSVSAKENIRCVIVDSATGNVQLMLSATQTTNLKTGKWLYDVEMTDRRGSEVTITSITGSGAEAVAFVDGTGSVTAVTVINPGSGYADGDATVSIDDARSGTPTGAGATATATITDGKISAITVTNGGSGYVQQPKERVIEGIINIKPEVTTADAALAMSMGGGGVNPSQ